MDAMTALMDRFQKMSDEVNVDAVFGKPETVEGRVLIPVAEVMYGFGMGSGTAHADECSCGCGCEAAAEEESCCEAESCCDAESCCEEEPCCEEESCECDAQEQATGTGGGGGARVRPIAYIEVGPDGTHVKPIVDEQKISLAGILLGFWVIGWVGLVLKTLFTPRS